MWLSYLRAELGRRPRRSFALLVLLSSCSTAIVLSSAASTGFQTASARAVVPLVHADTNIYLARRAPSAKSSDATAFAVEREQTRAAAVLDLSKLGAPGSRFTTDFFLPQSAPTFDASQLSGIAREAHIQGATAALTLRAVHREGTVPDIVASYVVEPATLVLAPPGPAEQAAVQACTIDFVRHQAQLHGPPPPKIRNTTPIPAQELPFDAAYYACLPPRLREVQIEEQVIKQIISPPITDVRQDEFEVAGIDPSASFGILRPSDLFAGGWLSPGRPYEALLSQAEAAKRKVTVGNHIQLGGRDLEVVGVVRTALGGLSAAIYLPLSTLQQISSRIGRVNVGVIQLDDSRNTQAVRHHLGQDHSDFAFYSETEIAGQVAGTLADLAALAAVTADVVAGLMAVATVVGVAVFIGASIHNRLPELAVLRVTGWSVLRLRLQLLTESIALALLGCALGVLVGVALLAAYGALPHMVAAVIIPPAIGEQVPRQLAAVTVSFVPVVSAAAVGMSAVIVVLGTGLGALWASGPISKVSIADVRQR